MNQAKDEAQLFAGVCGWFGALTFLSVTFGPPASGAPWLTAEIVGPTWLAICALAGWLTWRFRLQSTKYAAYYVFGLASLGPLGLIWVTDMNRRFLRQKRQVGL